MLLVGILLLYLLSISNVVYYEYRVIKNSNSAPQYITKRYVHLLLLRKYREIEKEIR